MASLSGYSLGTVQAIAMPANNATIPGTDPSNNMVVIDGTPIRVVVLALAAAAGLTALRWAGFKFNVGVSAG